MTARNLLNASNSHEGYQRLSESDPASFARFILAQGDAEFTIDPNLFQESWLYVEEGAMVIKPNNPQEDRERSVEDRERLCKAKNIDKSMARGFKAQGVRLGANGTLTLARGSVHTMVFHESTLLSIGLLLQPNLVDLEEPEPEVLPPNEAC